MALNPLICWFFYKFGISVVEPTHCWKPMCTLYIYIYVCTGLPHKFGIIKFTSEILDKKPEWNRNPLSRTTGNSQVRPVLWGGGLFQNQLGIEMLIMGMSPKYKHNEKRSIMKSSCVWWCFLLTSQNKGGIVHGTTPERRLQINTWEQNLILSVMASNISKNFYSTTVWQRTERRNQLWWKKAKFPIKKKKESSPHPRNFWNLYPRANKRGKDLKYVFPIETCWIFYPYVPINPTGRFDPYQAETLCGGSTCHIQQDKPERCWGRFMSHHISQKGQKNISFLLRFEKKNTGWIYILFPIPMIFQRSLVFFQFWGGKGLHAIIPSQKN